MIASIPRSSGISRTMPPVDWDELLGTRLLGTRVREKALAIHRLCDAG